jgi:MFS family permease
MKCVGVATSTDSRTATSLRGTGFWLLWVNAVMMGLVVSADRFTFIWLVDDTLGSPTWAVGLVVFALGAPVCALVLTAGALVDRNDRRRILLITQASGAVVLTGAALLVGASWVNLPSALAMAMVFGVVVAFALPVRSALVPVLVGSHRVMHAVVVMTIGANVAMIAGPLLVGGVIEGRGVAWAFALQAAFLLAGVASVWRLHVPPHAPVVERPRLRADIAVGLRYIWHHPELRALFGLLCVGGGLMGGGSFTLLPRLAREVFGREAGDAARLFALLGVGMVSMSFALMRYRHRIKRRGLFFMGFLILGTTGQILQGVAPTFISLQILMVLWGFTGGMYMNLNQSLIQELTPLDRMGRVMGLSTLVNAGLLPVGGLVAGIAASFIGVRAALSLFGFAALCCVITALVRAKGLRALA